jgi:hypothetical protein
MTDTFESRFVVVVLIDCAFVQLRTTAPAPAATLAMAVLTIVSVVTTNCVEIHTQNRLLAQKSSCGRLNLGVDRISESGDVPRMLKLTLMTIDIEIESCNFTKINIKPIERTQTNYECLLVVGHLLVASQPLELAQHAALMSVYDGLGSSHVDELKVVLNSVFVFGQVATTRQIARDSMPRRIVLARG